MAHRVNILLNDLVWEALQKAPRGERSRIVNSALIQWFQRRQRLDAARRMDELRGQLPPVSNEQIADWLRADRERQ